MSSELALQAAGTYSHLSIGGALVEYAPPRWPTQGTEEREPARAKGLRAGGRALTLRDHWPASPRQSVAWGRQPRVEVQVLAAGRRLRSSKQRGRGAGGGPEDSHLLACHEPGTSKFGSGRLRPDTSSSLGCLPRSSCHII